MRIVSLLPSTTEILFALGVGEDVVGVTFECDFPAEARGRRVVSGTAMPEGLDPAGIDAWVTAATAAGEDLYTLDAGALSDLDPDLVLTQDLCAVCAIDVDTVEDALAHLGCRAEVLSFDPHTIAEIADSVRAIGRAVGREQKAERLAATVDALDAARAKAPGTTRPRPDLVVVAPCGFDREGARAQERALLAAGVLPPGGPTYAVDANAHWARPGPRIVEGVEDLRTALGRPREGALGRPSW